MTIQEIQKEIETVCTMSQDDKFRRAIDKLTKSGLDISVESAGSGSYFKGKNDRYFKLKFKVGECGFLIGRVKKFWNATVSAETIERNPAIFDTTTEAIKEEFNGRYVYTLKGDGVECIKDDVQAFTWGAVALAISKRVDKDIARIDPCGRCGGNGHIPGYAHVYGGICFECCGVGGSLELIKEKG